MEFSVSSLCISFIVVFFLILALAVSRYGKKKIYSNEITSTESEAQEPCKGKKKISEEPNLQRETGLSTSKEAKEKQEKDEGNSHTARKLNRYDSTETTSYGIELNRVTPICDILTCKDATCDGLRSKKENESSTNISLERQRIEEIFCVSEIENDNLFVGCNKPPATSTNEIKSDSAIDPLATETAKECIPSLNAYSLTKVSLDLTAGSFYDSTQKPIRQPLVKEFSALISTEEDQQTVDAIVDFAVCSNALVVNEDCLIKCDQVLDPLEGVSKGVQHDIETCSKSLITCDENKEAIAYSTLTFKSQQKSSDSLLQNESEEKLIPNHIIEEIIEVKSIDTETCAATQQQSVETTHHLGKECHTQAHGNSVDPFAPKDHLFQESSLMEPLVTSSSNIRTTLGGESFDKAEKESQSFELSNSLYPKLLEKQMSDEGDIQESNMASPQRLNEYKPTNAAIDFNVEPVSHTTDPNLFTKSNKREHLVFSTSASNLDNSNNDFQWAQSEDSPVFNDTETSPLTTSTDQAELDCETLRKQTTDAERDTSDNGDDSEKAFLRTKRHAIKRLDYLLRLQRENRIGQSQFKTQTTMFDMAGTSISDEEVSDDGSVNDLDLNDYHMNMSNDECLKKAESLKLDGNELFKDREYVKAAKTYTEALKYSTTREMSAILLCNRAACYLLLKEYKQVVKDCNDGVFMDTTYVKLYLRRFRAYEAMEKWHEALADLNKTLELDPSLRGTYEVLLQKIQRESEMLFEKEKEEMLNKLKGFGNWALGKFGLSIDNFKVEQNQETGSYNISFQNNP